MPLDEQRTRRALRRFMSELGLEIRAPTAAIMGLSELLLMNKSHSLNEEQKEYLTTNIHQNSIKLAKAVDYLFRMAPVFYGGVDLSVEEVDLVQFIPQTIITARNFWLRWYPSFDIIEQQIPDELPSIWMDRQWMEEAIIGILSEVIAATYNDQLRQKVLLTVTHNDTLEMIDISILGEHLHYFSEESVRLFLVQAVTEQHNGQMEIRKTETQLEIILSLPISKNRPVSSE